MIVQKEFLNKLKDFGLNSYESKLWVALLSRGVSTAGELSDISNVPRSRAYDVLESLEKKGFVIVKVGKPIKYISVAPTEVVDRVKKKVMEDAEERHQMLGKLKDSEVLGELNSLHTEGVKIIDPTDKSGVFRGQEKAYEHLALLIRKAQKSVTLATSKEGLERKSSVLFNPLRKAAKNGVDVKIFVSGIDKEMLDEVSKFAKVKVNKVKNNARFCVVDNSEILFFLTDDKAVHKSYDSAVWIEAPHFMDYFNTMFDKEWKNS